MAATFLNQLFGEMYKLWARPRTYVGFAACLVFDAAASALLHIPSVQMAVARVIWKSRAFLGASAFAGPSIAAHTLGESITTVGTLGLALVVGDLIAKEAEDGTLRMILCRPVSYASLFWQKLITALVYAAVLALVASAGSLAIGLLFQGVGPLVLIAPHEGIIGTFDFRLGLHRYWLATLLLVVSSCSGVLVPFTLSCFRMKPAVAAILALTFFFTDDLVRTQPAFADLRAYCYTTRLITWRQTFNNEISWLKVRRNYEQLLWIDGALVAIGWAAFRRERSRL